MPGLSLDSLHCCRFTPLVTATAINPDALRILLREAQAAEEQRALLLCERRLAERAQKLKPKEPELVYEILGRV